MYPSALRAAEDEMIDERRAVAGVDGDAPRIGVACSGGGIRSATVCLGAFQAFARNDVLPRIDYISTVSGGGYFGSFLGSLYHPKSLEEKADRAAIPPRVAEALDSDQSPEVKWLRKNGRYIAPNGAADYFNIAAIYIRNWAGVQYVVGITCVTLFLLLIFVRALVPLACSARCGFQDMATTLPGFVVYWSPFLLLPLVVLVFVLIPLAWAFWLTQYGPERQALAAAAARGSPGPSIGHPFSHNMVLWASGFVVAAFGATWWLGDRFLIGPVVANGLVVGFVVGILAIAVWLVTEAIAAQRRPQSVDDDMVLQRRQSLSRNLLSDWLGACLKGMSALVAIALIDTLAHSVYHTLFVIGQGQGPALAATSLVTALLAVVHQVAPLLQRKKGMGTGWSLGSIASAAGLVFIVFILTTWGVLAYALAFRAGPSTWNNGLLIPTVSGFLAVGLTLTLFTAATMQFLNLSSLQSFYSARLRRAYLGAANPTRTRSAPKPMRELSIRRDVAGDDFAWADYNPHRHGGPLHLIGVTVNRTVGAGSDIDLRDRKGYTMTIGPGGMSANIDSHALFVQDRKAIEPLPCPAGVDPIFGMAGATVAAEACPLSRWMAISGAAFSTGLGANTRTGISVLLGTANVRLGYWWWSGAEFDHPASTWRTSFRVQSYLKGEFLGRFAGNAYQHWYLSDGGHSENTGAYELIRRRLPFIVLLDNGADRDYVFDDFGNLVRRVRIDFDVEIAPLPKASYARWRIDKAIASSDGLAGLRRGQAGDMGVALARNAIALFTVSYRDVEAQSLLILVKPTLVGDEPADVVNYAVAHPAFPQEPTSDQFFDEAQWESYRRLGQHIGTKVCHILARL